jgi:8-oxo-dGTP pyrophosphatase MutT (NUDIX family)
MIGDTARDDSVRDDAAGNMIVGRFAPGDVIDVRRDVGFAPTPNTLVLVRASAAPSAAAAPVTSVTVLVRDGTGRVLLTQVATRGYDLPGGHLDAAETPASAARREVREETGLVLPEHLPLVRLATLVLHVGAPVPVDYPYPHPTSQMWVFGMRLDGVGPAVRPESGSECVSARWVDARQVRTVTGPRVWSAVLDLAFE